MSLKVKAWLSSLRRTSSSIEDDTDSDDDRICPFDNVPSDVVQYILSFLHFQKLHEIRQIGKEWNYLCDVEQKILRLNIETPTKHIKYWMLKLRNIRIVDLSHNLNIDNQFLIWLKKDYLPLKLREKEKQRTSISSQYSLSSSSSSDFDIKYDVFVNDVYQINIHFDLSFCFGIDCVEEPQLYGRGGVNGHNHYLKKLMNRYNQHGVTFNIFGNFRIINPSQTLNPRHVVLLQLYSLKYNEIQHCFKFASAVNRQFTGPLPRFQRMIKNGYPTMINWDSCNIIDNDLTSDMYDNGYISPLSSDDDSNCEYGENGNKLPTKKHFIVTIIKKTKREKFKWTLSKQKFEPYAQCWMTDSVCSFYSH